MAHVQNKRGSSSSDKMRSWGSQDLNTFFSHQMHNGAMSALLLTCDMTLFLLFILH